MELKTGSAPVYFVCGCRDEGLRNCGLPGLHAGLALGPPFAAKGGALTFAGFGPLRFSVDVCLKALLDDMMCVGRRAGVAFLAGIGSLKKSERGDASESFAEDGEVVVDEAALLEVLCAQDADERERVIDSVEDERHAVGKRDGGRVGGGVLVLVRAFAEGRGRRRVDRRHIQHDLA